jgi:hypothetical protein
MTNGASAYTEPPTDEGGLVPRTTEKVNTEICGDGIENDGDGD